MGLVLPALISFAIWAAAAPAQDRNAARDAGLRVDPELVDSLSAAPPGLMRAEPYLVHFRKGSLNLYYVSANHEMREDSKTFSVIRRAFSAFPIHHVIIEGRLTADGPEVLFGKVMEWKRGAFGISPDITFDYAAFCRWYKTKSGAGFDPAKVDYQIARPDPEGTFLQRMADVTSNIRNRFLAGVITRELRKHGYVLVVYGNGHHAAQRRALIAAMGEPVYEGALAD